MANTYKSAVYLKNGRVRPDGENDAEEITCTVSIPDGVALASGDKLYFCKIGENVIVNQFELIMDAFDSNATADLDGKLGITASDACLLASATVLQTNTTEIGRAHV